MYLFIRPALLAHFYIGRMYSKFIVVPNSHDELNNINQTCQSYNNIVDYCDKYPDALSKVRIITVNIIVPGSDKFELQIIGIPETSNELFTPKQFAVYTLYNAE